MFQIDYIREKNLDKFYSIYLANGKNGLIESIAEGLGRRTYFSLNSNGNIKRNKMNRALLLVTTIDKNNYKKVIEILLGEMVDLTQREKIKKIERLSTYSIDTLTNNFNKIMASGDRIFGLKYGKELFFRDKELFFKMLFDYVLLENINTEKSIMAWSLYQLLKDSGFSNEVFYVGMSYLLQKKSEFNDYEKISYNNFIPTSKEKIVVKSKAHSLLTISSYGKILNEFTYQKEDIYIEMLKEALD